MRLLRRFTSVNVKCAGETAGKAFKAAEWPPCTSLRRSGHDCAPNLGSQEVDRRKPCFGLFKVPECPAIAGAASLRLRPHGVDGATHAVPHDRCVGHNRALSSPWRRTARRQGGACQAEAPCRMARAAPSASRHRERGLGVARLHGGDAGLRGGDIVRVALDADIAAARVLATAPVALFRRTGRARVRRFCCRQRHAREQGFGLLRRWAFPPPSSRHRSEPEQIGRSQSERI